MNWSRFIIVALIPLIVAPAHGSLVGSPTDFPIVLAQHSQQRLDVNGDGESDVTLALNTDSLVGTPNLETFQIVVTPIGSNVVLSDSQILLLQREFQTIPNLTDDHQWTNDPALARLSIRSDGEPIELVKPWSELETQYIICLIVIDANYHYAWIAVQPSSQNPSSAQIAAAFYETEVADVAPVEFLPTIFPVGSHRVKLTHLIKGHHYTLETMADGGVKWGKCHSFKAKDTSMVLFCQSFSRPRMRLYRVKHEWPFSVHR